MTPKEIEQYEKALKKFRGLTCLKPFHASHRYVDDRRGDTVLECSNDETAKIVAELLNSLPDPSMLKVAALPKTENQKNEVPKVVKVESPKEVETTESKIRKLL